MADDFVLNVRQIAQYAQVTATAPTDRYLLQQSGVGGLYKSIAPTALVSTALELGGFIKLAPNDGGISWNGASLLFDGVNFFFTDPIQAPTLEASNNIFVNGLPVAIAAEVTAAIDAVIANSVLSFNNRKGHVFLESDDILRAGGILQNNPRFSGVVIVPTPWDFRNDSEQAANCRWVQGVVGALLCSGSVVTSFNGRGGNVLLTAADITFAATQPGALPRANTPPLGDASTRIATTMFVDNSLVQLEDDLRQEIIDISNQNLAAYAPLASPQFSGVPTAPTASPGNNTGQLATTAYVQAAVTAATTGVASFNTRTGAVVLAAADITAAGGALLASPALTGTPSAPTATVGDNTTKIATTAFVHAAVAALAAGVTSFNTRTGAVTLVTADVTAAGGAPIASPTFTGVPAGPTAAPGTTTTQLATCAYVQAAVTASAAGVQSFNGRTGVVSLIANDISAAGGALNASPTFTGVPLAPTAAPGTNTQQIATTAYVMAQLAAGGVTSFNGRTGAISLLSADVSGAGGALLTSPAFSGTPTAPTPAVGTNSTQIATTAYVLAAVGGSIVSTFNGRSGAVTLVAADVTGAGGALLASPTFTGAPAAPTPAPGNSSTQLATTAFVQAALGGAVTSFNARSGAVTLQAADVSAVGGALLASPNFSGTPTAPTAVVGTATNQLATCQFVLNELGTVGGVTSFNGRAGVVTLTAADVTGVGGALLASPTFTGTPAAPTATAGTNTTQLASTAFVQAAVTAVAATYSAQVLTANGTYTTPAGSTTATTYRIRMVGGGGGGGGAGASATTGGASGGAGEYKELVITGQAAGSAWTVAIGAAGAAGTTTGTGGAGGNGTASSVTIGGQAIVCDFGRGGAGGNATTTGSAGGAGGAGGATPAISGLTLLLDLPGQYGSSDFAAGTAGGSNPLGFGGTAWGTAAANTTTGLGYGSGGSGTLLAGAVGKAGAPGIVIIERISG